MPNYRVGAAELTSPQNLESLVQASGPGGRWQDRSFASFELEPLGAVALLPNAPIFECGPQNAPERVTLRVRRASDGYLVELAGVGRFLVSAERIGYALDEGISQRVLEQALVDQIVPRALHLVGKPSLHASAAWLEGLGAVAFTGESGAGKSTLCAALAAHGCVVSDDSLSLEEDGEELLALPGYPSLRLWPDAACAVAPDEAHSLERATPRVPKLRYPRRLVDSPVPLRLVVVLQRTDDPTPHLEQLVGRVAFAALDGQVHRLAVDDPRALEAEFHLLTTVIERVPIMRLRYRPDLGRIDELIQLIASQLPR